MVAAEDDRHGAALVDVGDGLRDLVEGLLDVRGDREDVAEVTNRNRFAQVDAELEAVRAVERRDLANSLGAEASAGAIGGATVEGRAEDSNVVLAGAAHVLDVGRLQEGVDAGEVRQLAAAEGGDRAVLDRVGALEAELKAAGDLLVALRRRHQRLGLDGVFGLGAVVVVQRDLAAVSVVVGQRSILSSPAGSCEEPFCRE